MDENVSDNREYVTAQVAWRRSLLPFLLGLPPQWLGQVVWLPAAR